MRSRRNTPRKRTRSDGERAGRKQRGQRPRRSGKKSNFSSIAIVVILIGCVGVAAVLMNKKPPKEKRKKRIVHSSQSSNTANSNNNVSSQEMESNQDNTNKVDNTDRPVDKKENESNHSPTSQTPPPSEKDDFESSIQDLPDDASESSTDEDDFESSIQDFPDEDETTEDDIDESIQDLPDEASEEEAGYGNMPLPSRNMSVQELATWLQEKKISPKRFADIMKNNKIGYEKIAGIAQAKGFSPELVLHLSKHYNINEDMLLQMAKLKQQKALVAYLEQKKQERDPKYIAQQKRKAVLIEEFQEKFEKAKGKNKVISYIVLARWCEDNDLTEQAKEVYLYVLDLDDGNQRARQALGYVKIAGSWVKEEDAPKYGFGKYQGKWHRKTALAEMGLTEHKGEWLNKEEYAKVLEERGRPLYPQDDKETGNLWMTSYKDAITKATKSKKPLLINFTGSDWCGYCIKLEKEVFHTSYYQQNAPKEFVHLILDFPKKKKLPEKLEMQNEALNRLYEVTGYPSIYICSSDGFPLTKTGYQKKMNGIKYLEHLKTKYQKAALKDFDKSSFHARRSEIEALGLEKSQNKVTKLKRKTSTELKKSLVKTKFGDISITKLPVLSKKGRKSPFATSMERILKYQGINTSYKEIAKSVDANVEKMNGSEVTPSIRQVAKKYRLKPKKLKLKRGSIIRVLAPYINRGLPIVWLIKFESSFESDILAPRLIERKKQKLKPYYVYLHKNKKSEKIMKSWADNNTYNIKIIVGYNPKTKEIAYTDGWGGSDIKWATEDEVFFTSLKDTNTFTCLHR